MDVVMDNEKRLTDLENAYDRIEGDIRELATAHNDVSSTAGDVQRILSNYVLVLTRELGVSVPCLRKLLGR